MPTALITVPRSASSSEAELIAAVRRGDDRAFEMLYERYRARIQGFVAGMVGCPARAEDVTQEVFISALRRLRETDAEIAFRPWIYEIARNACIDHARRTRRRPEVPLVSEGDESGEAPTVSPLGALGTPDATVARKQQLADLCGAFGGLSETHHRILVMRELEGRSYAEIGESLGMSKTVVESLLFRARRKLTEEYDEIASGRRCEQVRALIDARAPSRAARGRLGARDRRRLDQHLEQCKPCRRHAHLAGFDTTEITRRRIGARVAGLLPIPWIGRSEARRPQIVPTPDQIGALGNLAPVVEGPLGAGAGRAAVAVMAIALASAGSGLVARSATLQPAPAQPVSLRAPAPAPGNSLTRHGRPLAATLLPAVRPPAAVERTVGQAINRLIRGAVRTDNAGGAGGVPGAAPGLALPAPANSSSAPSGLAASVRPAAGPGRVTAAGSAQLPPVSGSVAPRPAGLPPAPSPSPGSLPAGPPPAPTPQVQSLQPPPRPVGPGSDHPLRSAVTQVRQGVAAEGGVPSPSGVAARLPSTGQAAGSGQSTVDSAVHAAAGAAQGASAALPPAAQPVAAPIVQHVADAATQAASSAGAAAPSVSHLAQSAVDGASGAAPGVTRQLPH